MAETGPRILVVDDEAPIRRFLTTSLTAHGYYVSVAATGQEAVSAASSVRPDLVILDLNLPDLEGVEVTRLLRTWSAVPIIILSVREMETEKIAALDAGADDYLTKPFSMGELLARIRAALRRAANRGTPQAVFEDDDLKVDLERRAVSVGNQDVQLTPTEYDLLRTLVVHAGKVLTHRQLLRAVWGGGYDDEAHLLRVNVSNLRRKIEKDPTRPRHIVTEPGVGYRLRTP